jgi:hypothetical protein
MSRFQRVMAEVMMVAVGQTADPPASRKDDNQQAEARAKAKAKARATATATATATAKSISSAWAKDDGENKRRQQQIPPLRCGMTNKKWLNKQKWLSKQKWLNKQKVA